MCQIFLHFFPTKNGENTCRNFPLNLGILVTCMGECKIWCVSRRVSIDCYAHVLVCISSGTTQFYATLDWPGLK